MYQYMIYINDICGLYGDVFITTVVQEANKGL